MSSPPRAIGIIRVSKVKGRDKLRDGEAFHSPEIQRQKIEEECARREWRLLYTLEELDVSGGKALDKRPALGPSVVAVENGEAEAIVFAYRDRMDRSITTGSEAVERVEAAGGVLVADGQVVSHKRPDDWANATLGSFMSEYQRRIIRVKSGEAQERAVANGAAPFPRVPPGYLRADNGGFKPDPDTRAIIAQAFDRRAAGATIKEVRGFLQANGIDRTFGAVRLMLSSKVYLGEIHFGSLTNLEAHEPIVKPDVWACVQRTIVTAGRKTKSDRLLARLGVLRCASCGSRMVASTQTNVYKGKRTVYPLYRCPPTCDCDQRVTISAPIVEAAVVEEVKRLLEGIKGTADAQSQVNEAKAELEACQAAFDSAIRVFDELGSEPAAIKRLGELRQARDDAQDRLDHARSDLGALSLVVTANGDWDDLSFDGQRELIRAVIERVTITSGRGTDRIFIEPKAIS
jgi:site-specific DNA recombinase